MPSSPQPFRPHTMRRALRTLLVAALGVTLLASATPAVASTAAARPNRPIPPASDPTQLAPVSAAAARGCATPLLRVPMRAERALATLGAVASAKAAQRNDTSLRALRHAATDHSLWLDTCGAAYYVEAAHSAEPPTAATSGAEAAAAEAPLAQTFNLSSRPGADKTIYLDFTGHTVQYTGWNTNDTAGQPFYAEPYSITAPADTNFTDDELTQIQIAWASVAEDFASFDVNVTTAEPPLENIARHVSDDPKYGTRVVVTAGGPVYDNCHCGGVAYLDVFDYVGFSAYQPAFVFTNGSSTNGLSLAQVASHEVGHNLSLHHDGDALGEYARGTFPWAPVMGSSYHAPVSQWSSGEYPNATNKEDDVAILAAKLGYRADDVADTAEPTTPQLASGTPQEGTIETRTDTDTFAFSAFGDTQVQVRPTAASTNLDVALTIRDSSGTVMARVDPQPDTTVPAWSSESLAATWATTVTDPAGRYTATVEGIGSGDPTVPGKYSDYASLGAYRITVTTAGTIFPVTVTAAPTTPFIAEQPGTVEAFTAAGGVRPFTWRASGLPPGLSMDPATATISGIPTTAGTYTVTATATDSRGQSGSTAVSLTVRPPVVAAENPQYFSGRAGEPLSGKMVATGGDGSYTWGNATGPSWVTVAPDGTIRGTPPAPGYYDVVVQVASAGHTAWVQASLSISWPLLQSPDQTHAVPLGQPTTIQLTGPHGVTGGSGDYSWWSAQTPGLGVEDISLSQDGQLNVTATEMGDQLVEVDFLDIRTSTWRTFHVTLDVQPTPLVATIMATAEVRAHEYGVTPSLGSASGGSGPRTYVWSATNLPPGLWLTSWGDLRGPATEAGLWQSRVTVTSGQQSITRTVAIRVLPRAVHTVSVSLWGKTGYPLSKQLTALDGDGTYRWSSQAPLPAGLILSPSGLLSGTPRQAGEFDMWLTVESEGRTDTQYVRVTIAQSKLEMLTSQLPNARAKARYTAKVKVTGSNDHITWRTKNLPSWLTARPNATGTVLTLSGTPKARAGYRTLTFTATDTSGLQVTRRMSILVR